MSNRGFTLPSVFVLYLKRKFWSLSFKCVIFAAVNCEKKYRFEFKQFGINDNDCAMKVGTDGVLLGAWCDVTNANRVLDVGSGCGLIALMIAQRSGADILGIEIDPAAAKQSIENINDTHWCNRIDIINDDFVKWVGLFDGKMQFDHIVSNPPFFSNGPTAPLITRATARHDESLSYEQLISLSKKLLCDNGKLSMISPIERKDDITFCCELAQMYISRLTMVYSMPTGKATRILWEISKEKCVTQHLTLAIRNTENNYSDEYIKLTKDFYLNI